MKRADLEQRQEGMVYMAFAGQVDQDYGSDGFLGVADTLKEAMLLIENAEPLLLGSGKFHWGEVATYDGVAIRKVAELERWLVYKTPSEKYKANHSDAPTFIPEDLDCIPWKEDWDPTDPLMTEYIGKEQYYGRVWHIGDHLLLTFKQRSELCYEHS